MNLEKYIEGIRNDPDFRKFLEEDFKRFIFTGRSKTLNDNLLKELIVYGG
jgi:hypothetical protein